MQQIDEGRFKCIGVRASRGIETYVFTFVGGDDEDHMCTLPRSELHTLINNRFIGPGPKGRWNHLHWNINDASSKQLAKKKGFEAKHTTKDQNTKGNTDKNTIVPRRD